MPDDLTSFMINYSTWVITSSLEKKQFNVKRQCFFSCGPFTVRAWMTLALLIISTMEVKYMNKSGFFYEQGQSLENKSV